MDWLKDAWPYIATVLGSGAVAAVVSLFVSPRAARDELSLKERQFRAQLEAPNRERRIRDLERLQTCLAEVLELNSKSLRVDTDQDPDATRAFRAERSATIKRFVLALMDVSSLRSLALEDQKALVDAQSEVLMWALSQDDHDLAPRLRDEALGFPIKVITALQLVRRLLDEA